MLKGPKQIQKSFKLKDVAMLSDHDPINLTAYDSDNNQTYEVETDLKSLKTILNFNPNSKNHPRANFTDVQAFFFVRQMSDEQVDSLLASSYLKMSQSVKKQMHIKFETKNQRKEIMQNQGKEKVLVQFNATTPINIKSYVPDIEQEFKLTTDAKTVKYLFNHNQQMIKKCGFCKDYETAYVLARGLDEEQVEEVICQSFLETPIAVRDLQHLILSIERSD